MNWKSYDSISLFSDEEIGREKQGHFLEVTQAGPGLEHGPGSASQSLKLLLLHALV